MLLKISFAFSFVSQVICETGYFCLSECKIDVVRKTSPIASSLIINILKLTGS